MVKKLLKIVLDVIVSLVVFLILAMILDLLAGKIFGTHAGPEGDKVLNVNGGVMVVTTLALTLLFSVWFYKLLTNYKLNKVKE